MSRPPVDRAYFPAFLDLRGRLAVVAGGGTVGKHKSERLLRCGARVCVISPHLRDPLLDWAEEGTILVRRKHFEPSDLEGAAIAIAASNDRAVNAAVAAAARARGIPVDVSDDPALSTFIMPALVDRGPVQVAVSTGGASPILAKRIADLLAEALPPEYGLLAELAAEHRAKAKRRFPDPDARRAFWERVIDGPVGRAVLAGRLEEARLLLRQELEPPTG